MLTSIVNAQTKKALIRLEDAGPQYGNTDGSKKLKVIANYLAAEKIPFQITPSKSAFALSNSSCIQ